MASAGGHSRTRGAHGWTQLEKLARLNLEDVAQPWPEDVLAQSQMVSPI